MVRGATLELTQDLIVTLTAHHDLTVDVLNVHVLSAMSSIGPHQTRFVRDADVVDSGGRSRVLQR